MTALGKNHPSGIVPKLFQKAMSNLRYIFLNGKTVALFGLVCF